VDNRARLKEILKGLEGVQKEFSLPVVFPVHPRTEKRIKELGIGVDGLNLTKPFGFLEFLQLESQAKLVLTDSGGVQEETCVLGVPCATMRYDTERPETLDVGSNILVGADAKRILEGVRSAATRKRGWKNPYGTECKGRPKDVTRVEKTSLHHPKVDTTKSYRPPINPLMSKKRASFPPDSPLTRICVEAVASGKGNFPCMSLQNTS